MSAGDAMLASDAERSAAVERLQNAHIEGRLTDDEVVARIDAALRARTRGELAALLQDLPGASPHPSGAVVPVPEPALPAVRERSGLRQAWTAWAIASSVTFVVWGITALTAGFFIYPWFLWVAGPWGAVLLIKTLLGERGEDG